MPARNYSSTAEAKTLSGAIVAGATSMTLNSITTLPSTPNIRPYTLVIDPDLPTEEIVTVTANPSGNVLTIVRGQDGTSDQAHLNSAVVKHMITARDLKEPQDHIYTTAGAHGVTGAIVGATDAQVLTNKTINSSNNTLTVAQSAVTNLVSDLATKAPLAAPTFTGTVVLPSTTSIGNVSATEIGYIDGVTSGIQAQLDAKLPLSGGTLTGNLVSSGVGTFTTNNAAGRGVCITQPSGDTQPAILQFTNNAVSVQRGSISVSAAGVVSVNSASNSIKLNGAVDTTGDIHTDTDVLSRAVWTNGINLNGSLSAYNGGSIYTDTGSIYNYVGTLDSVGCRPISDNVGSVGSSTRRWVRVYAVNTTISSSDERDKLDITDSPLGLEFINDLRPVSYRWKVGEKTPVLDEDGKPVLDENGEATFTIREGVRKHYGLVSQQVKQALDNSGAGDFAGWVKDDMSDPDSHQSLSYEQFIAPLIKAVQELSAEVETLKTKVAELEAN